jgi:hypothetical protein
VDVRIEWVLQDFSVRAPVSRYEGAWHATADDLEEEGRWDSLPAALAWGRARAPIVLLSLWVGSPRRWMTYSAGTSSQERFLDWHEPADSGSPRVEHYSGLVQIREMYYDLEPRDTYSLMTKVREGGEIVLTGGESGLRLLDALEVARARSKFVVLGFVRFPDDYDYFNAGADPAPATTYPPYAS